MTWKMPELHIDSFKQDENDPNLYWFIGRSPTEDFRLHVGANEQSFVMTPSRGWAPAPDLHVSEWRPLHWDEPDLDGRIKTRVRFVW